MLDDAGRVIGELNDNGEVTLFDAVGGVMGWCLRSWGLGRGLRSGRIIGELNDNGEVTLFEAVGWEMAGA